MSITRNNHYVPQWYQEGFFEPGRSSLAYVGMTPDQMVLPDGRVIVQNLRGQHADLSGVLPEGLVLDLLRNVR